MSSLFAGRLPGNAHSHSRWQSLPAKSSWDPNCEEFHAAGQGESTFYSPPGIKNKPAAFQGNLSQQVRPDLSWQEAKPWVWISSLIEESNPDFYIKVFWREIPLLIQFTQPVVLIHPFYYLQNVHLNNTVSSLHRFCRSLLEIICHLRKRWALLST